MKLLKITVIVALAALSSIASATLISTHGSLTYNDDNPYILNAVTNTRYLNWTLAATLNYAETVAVTAQGGRYAEYHIATQAEAYVFANSAARTPLLDDPASLFASAEISGLWSHGDWGAIPGTDENQAFFISAEPDTALPVGYVSVIDWALSPASIHIEDAWGSYAISDQHAHNPQFSGNITWLLVSDATIDEPTPLALMALGLLGLAVARAKNAKNGVIYNRNSRTAILGRETQDT